MPDVTKLEDATARLRLARENLLAAEQRIATANGTQAAEETKADGYRKEIDKLAGELRELTK